MDSNRKRALQTVGCMFDEIEGNYTAEETYLVYNQCMALNYKDDSQTKHKVGECWGVNYKNGYDFLDDAINVTPKVHSFIPWETVEGMTLTQSDRDAIHEDVLQWACEHYKGESVAACKG